MLRNNDPTTIQQRSLVGQTWLGIRKINETPATVGRGEMPGKFGVRMSGQEEKERVTPKELGCREKRVGEVFPLF